MDHVSDLSLSQHRLQQEFRATRPAVPHSTNWLHHPAAGMCYISLLSLHCISHSCSTHPLLRILSLPCMSCVSLFCAGFVHSFFSNLSLKMTGSQVWLWLRHLGRQRQASPRQRGYSCCGFRCSAKRAGHGTTFVSISAAGTSLFTVCIIQVLLDSAPSFKTKRKVNQNFICIAFSHIACARQRINLKCDLKIYMYILLFIFLKSLKCD